MGSGASQQTELTDAQLINALAIIARADVELAAVAHWFHDPNIFERSVKLEHTSLLAYACRRIGSECDQLHFLIAAANAFQLSEDFLHRHPRLWYQVLFNHLHDSDQGDTTIRWLDGLRKQASFPPMLLQVWRSRRVNLSSAVHTKVTLPSAVMFVRHVGGARRKWVVAGRDWLGVIQAQGDGYEIGFGKKFPEYRCCDVAVSDDGCLVACMVRKNRQHCELKKVHVDLSSYDVKEQSVGRFNGFSQLSHDGRLLLGNLPEGGWKLHGLEDGDPVKIPVPEGTLLGGVGFAPNGAPECFGITRQVDRTDLWQFDVARREEVSVPLKHKFSVPAIARSQHGFYNAVYETFRQSSYRVSVIDSHGRLRASHVIDFLVESVVFDEESKLIYLNGRNGQGLKIDIDGPSDPEEYLIAGVEICDADIDLKRGEIAYVQGTDAITFVGMEDAPVSGEFSEKPVQVRDFAFDEQGEMLVIAASNHLRVVKAESGRFQSEFKKHVFSPSAALIVPTKPWVVSASNVDAYLWDMTTGEVVKQIASHGGTTTGMPELAVSPDGKTVAIWLPNQVYRCETETDKPPIALPGTAPIACSPNSQFVALTNYSERTSIPCVEIYDGFGEQRGVLRFNESVSVVNQVVWLGQTLYVLADRISVFEADVNLELGYPVGKLYRTEMQWPPPSDVVADDVYKAEIIDSEVVISDVQTQKFCAAFPLKSRLRRPLQTNIFVQLPPEIVRQRPGRDEWAIHDGEALKSIRLVKGDVPHDESR